jgi:hypothetical protein
MCVKRLRLLGFVAYNCTAAEVVFKLIPFVLVGCDDLSVSCSGCSYHLCVISFFACDHRCGRARPLYLSAYGVTTRKPHRPQQRRGAWPFKAVDWCSAASHLHPLVPASVSLSCNTRTLLCLCSVLSPRVVCGELLNAW